MKKVHLIIMTSLALVATLALGTAFAADKGGIYVGVKGGYEYKDHTSSGLTDSAAAGVNQNATSWDKWTDKSGYTIGGAIGYNFAGMGLPVRAEAEYLYHDQFKYNANNATGNNAGPGTGVFSAKMNIHTLFANFYYDIKTGTAFTPYVGAGLGVAWIDQKVSGLMPSTVAGGSSWAATDDKSTTTTNFAWNVGAGVGYSMTDNIIVDLGYRYTDFGDGKKFSNAAGTLNFQVKDITAHEALVGLRYQF